MPERPRVSGYKKQSQLSETQKKLVQLVCSAITGSPTMQDSPTVEINFGRHNLDGGWVIWFTTKNYDEELDLLYDKVRYLKKTVETEKEQSGSCRVFLIPVARKKDGWEGFKIRVDLGERLVHQRLR